MDEGKSPDEDQSVDEELPQIHLTSLTVRSPN